MQVGNVAHLHVFHVCSILTQAIQIILDAYRVDLQLQDVSIARVVYSMEIVNVQMPFKGVIWH